LGGGKRPGSREGEGWGRRKGGWIGAILLLEGAGRGDKTLRIKKWVGGPCLKIEPKSKWKAWEGISQQRESSAK